MHVTPFQQRVRNAVASFEARWHGRAPSSEQLRELLAPTPLPEIQTALAALESLGYVHRVGHGWRSRAATTTSRADASLATHARLQPTHY